MHVKEETNVSQVSEKMLLNDQTCGAVFSSLQNHDGYAAVNRSNVNHMNKAKMAPDILEVIISGLGNPVTGLALTMKKIAEKAKAETETETVTK